jgi:hypothetical protein
MHTIYSLDDTIKSFFETQPGVTRQQCDNLAISLVGGPVSPTPIQGAFSYTVIAGVQQAKIVQFRAQSSVLDMKTLSLARAIHGEIVVACAYHGDIGQPSPLSVYEMDRLPGTTYIEARCINGHSTEPSPETSLQHSNTVEDFARYVELYATSDRADCTGRFFAASWKHRQIKPLDVAETIHKDCEQKLELLSRVLPVRYTESLSKARTELPLLFTSAYPLVLSHDDLCEMNILVDLNSGHITGIIDWAEARILPFGFSLWGFENVLGFMDSQGWHYYNNHRELEKCFWQAFEQSVGGVSEADRQAIRVARMVGFFLRYGFVWEDGVRQIPAKESDSSLKYLDALV